MGNYYECLEIHENMEYSNVSIDGKYCVVGAMIKNTRFEANTDNQWPIDHNDLRLNDNITQILKDYEMKHSRLKKIFGTNVDKSTEHVVDNVVFKLAICIPKVCTTREAVEGLFINLTTVGFDFKDDFCRLPNDKPWIPGDYVAISILSLIGFLVIMGTVYDIWYLKKTKKPESINNAILSFSLLKNLRDLFTISKRSGTLDCLDGLRALSMLWVVIGHSFSSQTQIVNGIDAFQWLKSMKSLWVIAAPIAVDTFFTISGLLLVYVATKKMTSMGLIKSLHLFYLHRVLRMFPVLAFVVLMEATLFNHISDGPFWERVAKNSENCKRQWWLALLHFQNYGNLDNMCIAVSWYLSIDVQLHLLSPLVLFWVLNGKRLLGWGALIIATLLTMTAATIYNFEQNFSSTMLSQRNLNDHLLNYMEYYYVNTLTRASPFLVGMIYGYMLHLLRNKKLNISQITNLILWILALALMLLIIYIPHPTMQEDWEYQNLDNIINSFMRPAWAIALGWLITACAHGYGGPINTFLSLNFWKIPARVSYALYLIHYSLMAIINSSKVAPTYFSVGNIVFHFCAYLFISLLIAILITVLIDFPIANLLKLILSKGIRKTENNK
ncbi:nose resistant to fluoxetine protein 6-like isoform X2 [Leptidea sinapis]|nr:nose resistant to fluoxetine protein 6-like isoform X2 [Leptidea sinapis]